MISKIGPGIHPHFEFHEKLSVQYERFHIGTHLTWIYANGEEPVNIRLQAAYIDKGRNHAYLLFDCRSWVCKLNYTHFFDHNKDDYASVEIKRAR